MALATDAFGNEIVPSRGGGTAPVPSAIMGVNPSDKMAVVRVSAAGSLLLDGSAITIGDVSIEKMVGGLPEHWNGTATDTAATVTFSDTTRNMLIDNTGTANDLLFSLDGGTKWKTLGPEASVSLQCDRASIKVKCNAGLTTTYEIIAVVAEA